MLRRAAVTTEYTGATKLWAGTVTIDAKAKTGAHHHGDLESVIYVVNGVARRRWGNRLEFVAQAEAGDFIHLPPFVPHREINARDDLQLHCVLARSGQRGLVYNLDIEAVETPELVRWIDDLHKSAERRPAVCLDLILWRYPAAFAAFCGLAEISRPDILTR